MYGFLKPPPPQAATRDDAAKYARLRWQVFFGIFIGYAGYYVVRHTFNIAMPHLKSLGFSNTELGVAMSGISIAYGLSKFLMGSISDRSNSRYFMAIGLFISAATMIFMGAIPWATSKVSIMFVLLFVNGWFQGMGWPPSGRVMTHWFSQQERGRWMSFWHVAHNIGGGMAPRLATLAFIGFGVWQSIFFAHGIVALLIVVLIIFAVRDTPQSEGLVPIEHFKNEYPVNFEYTQHHESEFSTKQVFVDHVLKNRLLWIIAFANAFVYLVRYGVVKWAPLYLSDVKGFTFSEGNWAYTFYEFAGIPGTIVCGFLSDKLFNRRRSPAIIIYMLLTTLCVVIYWLNPPGNPKLDIAMLIGIGFLIYGPVMLLAVFALDSVPKKAPGTAIGFIGFFGYVGGAVAADIAIPAATDFFNNWDAGFIVIISACVMAIVLTAFTIKAEMRSIEAA